MVTDNSPENSVMAEQSNRLGADFVVWVGVVIMYYTAAGITGWFFCYGDTHDFPQVVFLFLMALLYVASGTRTLLSGVSILRERYSNLL